MKNAECRSPLREEPDSTEPPKLEFARQVFHLARQVFSGILASPENYSRNNLRFDIVYGIRRVGKRHAGKRSEGGEASHA
jgi:hypothetical protein